MNRSFVMTIVALLLVASMSMLATADVDCGTLGTLPISGCLVCEEVTFNATNGGHGPGWRGPRGGRGRMLLRGGPGGGGPGGSPGDMPPGGFMPPFGSLAEITMPNCTECDAANNFVLASGHGKHGGPGRGRGNCVCADGYGTVKTGQVNVTVGNATIPFDQFTCELCAAGEVPLGRNSGLVPSYDSTTETWSLVLNTTVTGKKATRVAARAEKTSRRTGAPVLTSSVGATFLDAGLASSGTRFEPAVLPPWTPGECVPCPDGSATTDGITCVAV